MVPNNPSWSHIVLYCPIQSLMVPYSTLWSYTVPYCPIQSLMVQYSPLGPIQFLRSHTVSYGPIHSFTVPYSPIQSLMVPYSPLLSDKAQYTPYNQTHSQSVALNLILSWPKQSHIVQHCLIQTEYPMRTFLLYVIQVGTNFKQVPPPSWYNH